jgi:pentatricopeptide repeat protein
MKTTNVETPENIWKEYSDKQNKDYLKLYKETNRVKADTQILVYEIEGFLEQGNLEKAKELLKEITKKNKL